MRCCSLIPTFFGIPVRQIIILVMGRKKGTRALIWWKAKRQSNEAKPTTVGLAVVRGEITAVACDGEVDGHPHIVAWETFASDSPTAAASGLQNFVEKNGLENWPCRCTLSPEDYSLRLIERPANVPDDELVDATRWLVKDLIEFDVEEAELAILTIPETSGRARTPRMFVVAAKTESVQDLSHAIEGAGLCLAGFDIVESSMLTLEALMPEVVAGGAALQIDEKSSVLTLAFSGHLYVARNLHVDGESIEAAAQHALQDTPEANSQISELLDPLLLDIQRSLDYYESEFGQATASRLTLFPSQADLSTLVPTLSSALHPVKVETFDLTRHFHFETPPPTNVQPVIGLAAGSAIARPGLIADALVPSRFKGPAEGFGLLESFKIAAGVAILFGIYATISWVQLSQERQALALLEINNALTTERVDALRAVEELRAASKTNPKAEIEALRATRDTRLSMLRDLGQNRSQTNSSFSNLLASLARQDFENIWLERIEFLDGGDSIALEGRSLRAEDVPSFLNGLGTEESFQGRRFRAFEISGRNSEIPGVTFRIATLDADADGQGGEE